ncbi:MAG: NUDIX domain-containing protein [Chloroflexi bacterium]|nr:NUDIX domain-containing protein [Chloroflexota bacterium]
MSRKSKKKKARIRPLAVCVFRRGDKIFVSRGYDSHKGQAFYRPIGGRIEFGERGSETVMREVREEIGAEVVDVVYLGALENIFTYEKKAGHEIILIYDGAFRDPAMNHDELRVEGRDDGDILYEGSWKPLSFFRGDEAPPLYPTGLLALLDNASADTPPDVGRSIS